MENTICKSIVCNIQDEENRKDDNKGGEGECVHVKDIVRTLTM